MSELQIYSLIILVVIVTAYTSLKKLINNNPKTIEVRYSFHLQSHETGRDMGVISLDPDSPNLLQEFTRTVESIVIPSEGMGYIRDGLDRPLAIKTVILAPNRVYAICEPLIIDIADSEDKQIELQECGWRLTPDWEIEQQVESGNFYN